MLPTLAEMVWAGPGAWVLRMRAGLAPTFACGRQPGVRLCGETETEEGGMSCLRSHGQLLGQVQGAACHLPHKRRCGLRWSWGRGGGQTRPPILRSRRVSYSRVLMARRSWAGGWPASETFSDLGLPPRLRTCSQVLTLRSSFCFLPFSPRLQSPCEKVLSLPGMSPALNTVPDTCE